MLGREDGSRNSFPSSTPSDDGAVNDLPRRDLLAGLGRFAYAAPALALLTRPKLAQADYGGGRGGTRDGSGGGPRDRG